jgi:hypothetical protein
MAPGNQSCNEIKDQQYGLVNADGLEQTFRDATDFCVSHEGHYLFSVRVSDKETLHPWLSQESVH